MVWIHRVKVGNISEVSNVHAASIFKVELCRFSQFIVYLYTSLDLENARGMCEDVDGLSGPIVTVYKSIYVKK
jgi:hypothetical protein